MRSEAKILIMDYGTTALKIAAFDESLLMVACVSEEFHFEYPDAGYVEIETETLWDTAAILIQRMKTMCSLDTVTHISITSNAETVCTLGRDGSSLRECIIWLDTRSQKQCERLSNIIPADEFYSITGMLEYDVICPANKIAWIRENEPDVYHKAWKFLLLKDYILYRMTGEAVTEPSILSFSGYFNINSLSYCKEILDAAGIDEEKLPEIMGSSERVGSLTGEAAGFLGLPVGIVVLSGMLDQCASVIGAGNVRPGIISETTGTVLAIGATIEGFSQKIIEKKVPVICHGINGKHLALLYSPTAGIVLKWFKDNFCIDLTEQAEKRGVSVYDVISQEAGRVCPKESLVLLPHFCGRVSPGVNAYAKGELCGLDLSVTRGDIARAIFEGIAFMLKENLDYLAERGIASKEILSLGGGARSSEWLQIKADATGRTIVACENEESTVAGCAYMAGLHAGYLKSITDAQSITARGKVYLPEENADFYKRKYLLYKECYERLKDLHR